MAPGDGIRRNIAHVDPSERALLRDAFLELNRRFYPGSRTDTPPGGVTWWFKQDEIHAATHVHNNPEFVPWHRELVNRLEELLREVNPQLSLHYWDWTQDPRNIPNANLGGGRTGVLNLFTPDFMGYGGATDQPIGPPWQNASAPWRSDGFYVPGASPHRDNSGNPADPPATVVRHVAGSPATAEQDNNIINAPDYPTMWTRLRDVHDVMHGFVNMGGAHISFRDPFVFLLHSNLDRLYAMWQTVSGHPERLDGATVYGSDGVSPSVLDNTIKPWDGAPPTTRPWAPPENEHVAKTYKHPSIVAPPRYDTRRRTKWRKVGDLVPEWSDASGWDDETNYSTMRLAVARDDLYLLARGDAGVYTWRFDTASSTLRKVGDLVPEWSDASGWDDETNYSTMRLAVARDDLYLLARGNAGVYTWRFDTRRECSAGVPERASVRKNARSQPRDRNLTHH
jgi:Common central domain of tyrosinase